jgi:hypothetical protein
MQARRAGETQRAVAGRYCAREHRGALDHIVGKEPFVASVDRHGPPAASQTILAAETPLIHAPAVAQKSDLSLTRFPTPSTVRGLAAAALALFALSPSALGEPIPSAPPQEVLAQIAAAQVPDSPAKVVVGAYINDINSYAVDRCLVPLEGVGPRSLEDHGVHEPV